MIGPLSAPNGDTTPIIDDKLCVKSKITLDKCAPRESGVISRTNMAAQINYWAAAAAAIPQTRRFYFARRRPRRGKMPKSHRWWLRWWRLCGRLDGGWKNIGTNHRFVATNDRTGFRNRVFRGGNYTLEVDVGKVGTVTELLVGYFQVQDRSTLKWRWQLSL